MTTELKTLRDFAAYLRQAINSHSGKGSSAQLFATQFNELSLALFALQHAKNLPYRTFCESRKVLPLTIKDWREIPAMPAVAFKEFELTSLPVAERTEVFHSSGTTEQRPSRHFHNSHSISIYEASLLPPFKAHLLPDAGDIDFLFLTPTSKGAPYSSLVHMFEIIRKKFKAPESSFHGSIENDGSWNLDLKKIQTALQNSVSANRPIMLLGTAFNFVHLLDYLIDTKQPFKLPPGSRVMETGGYKGRSRTLPKSELHSLITQWLGVSASHIVCEYGMSELSSQAYDRVAGQGDVVERKFRFPPWARLQLISPESGREVADGETGLIRIFDLANVYSVMALQTEDLGVRHGYGFELLGRAAFAEARGCSIMSV